MEWRDEGIVLGTRRHGETSAVLEVMTRLHGRHLGLVRGGRSRKQQPTLQVGNLVDIVGIDPAAGKGDLAGVVAHRVGPLGQDDAGFRPVGDRDQHRRRDRIGTGRDSGQRPGKSRVARSNLRRRGHAAGQRRAETLHQRHAGSGKNAPLLVTPGGSLSSASSASS